MENKVCSTEIQHFQLEQFDKWYESLLRNGCVVLKNILSKDEVSKAEDAFWQWLEALGSGLKRNDPSTWLNQNWPGADQMGFFVSYGGCHNHTSWMVRTNPKVKQAFSKIWKTDNLITSFDTSISWRPWWNPVSKGYWNPYVENIHVDQNPYMKKGLQCVQGMLALKRVRKYQVGGLMVVPGSNSEQVQQQIIKRNPQVMYSSSDWLQLSHKDPLMKNRVLVECDAGDLILWDSRTVHGGKICQPNQQFMKQHSNQLVRLAVTVTMVPRQRCSQQKLKLRREYFQKRIGTTHWPQEVLKNGMGKMASGIKRENITYEFPQLTPEMDAII